QPGEPGRRHLDDRDRARAQGSRDRRQATRQGPQGRAWQRRRREEGRALPRAPSRDPHKGEPALTLTFENDDEPNIVRDLALITSKPMFYVANVKEDQ